MRTLHHALAAASLTLVIGCTRPATNAAWTNPFPDAQAPGERDDTHDELANKRVVLQYFDAVNNAKDFMAASPFVAPAVELHDPELADGSEGLQARIRTLKEQYPNARSEVKRVLTSGPHIFLHSHTVRTPGTVGFIAGDIFRLENGKVVEQWSVLHAIPEKPHPDNPNGPF